MSVSSFFFYLFSALILTFGVLTVTAKALFRSAIYLLFTLTNISALYFMMQYEFIAAVQIIVYVGGIVVLILFSLFLTQQAGVKLSRPSGKQMAFAFLLASSGFAFIYTLIYNHPFQASTATPIEGYQVAEIGKQMVNMGRDGYILPFEAVSILLLAALIGCIAIAYKPTDVKTQIKTGNGKEEEKISTVFTVKQIVERVEVE
jgi:NADH-quinone oxidoreductase subunit J